MNDPIADMLIRIKNGYMAKKAEVDVPASRFKDALLVLLQKYRYIKGVSKDEDQKKITVTLHYAEGKPALTEVKRVSKPGLRRYMSAKELDDIRQGLGYLIVSTPKGVMTHIEARKNRLGGEVICKIW